LALVKLIVNPFNGWGWFDDTNAVDVPPKFELDAEIVEPGEPFRAVLGKLPKDGHPLEGMWILLSQRHSPYDGDCNLRAFIERPTIGSMTEPIPTKCAVSCFASVTVISTYPTP
jgi:hypothetical protein